MPPSGPLLGLVLVGATAFLAGCSPSAVTGWIAGRAEDCLDSDGCTPDDEGTPLRLWVPPLLHAFTEFGVEADRPNLLVLLVAREWTPFCPDVPATIFASIDGLVLERADWDVVFGCPEVAWRLGPDEWPDDHVDESVVEVGDGETGFILSLPFSLTRPPAWALGDTTLQPGTRVKLEGVPPPVQRLQIDLVGLEYEGGGRALAYDYDDGSIFVDIPGDAPLGTATLTVMFTSYSDVVCERTEYCEGGISGTQVFDVEVAVN